MIARLALCLLMIFGLAPLPAMAQATGPGVTFLDFGIYCSVEEMEQQKAEDTISGVVNLVPGPPPFVRKTHIIPARRGLGFGVHLRVLPEFQGEAVVQTLHPPMGPDGITTESWQTFLEPDRLSLHGFTFEYSYELLPGDWSISATSNGRLIYRVDFMVVDPGQVPEISCLGNLMS